MTESMDGTLVHDQNDPAITDTAGHTYSLNDRGQVLIMGHPDDKAPHFQKLAYRGRQIWGQDRDGQWHCKRRPQDPWVTGPSPLSDDQFAEVDRLLDLLLAGQGAMLQVINSNQQDILNAIQQIDQSTVLQALKEQQATLESVQTDQADQDTALQSLKEQQTETLKILQGIESTLQKILTYVGSGMPSKIVLDLPNAIVTSQPVPAKPGP